MISAFGVEHGDISKGIHSEALAARHVHGATSLKSFVIHVGKNPMVKKRVGQLRRQGDSRVDNPNQVRAYKNREGKVSAAFVPPNPRFAKAFTMKAADLVRKVPATAKRPPNLKRSDLVRKPVTKSYTKMAPKLAGALKSYDPAKSTSLTQKLRHHAGVNRLEAGATGRQGSMNRGFPRMMAQDAKKQATALNAGASNAAKRKRYLP